MNTHRERKDIRDNDDDDDDDDKDDDDDEGILASGRFCWRNDENKKIVLKAVIIMTDMEKGVYGSCTYGVFMMIEATTTVKSCDDMKKKGKGERERVCVCVCLCEHVRACVSLSMMV